MSDAPIRPAMDAEQWADVTEGVHLQQWRKLGMWSLVRVTRDEHAPDPDVVIEDPRPYEGRRVLRYASEDAHALAALCLHEQPFGFGWTDVDMLLAVEEHATECHGFPVSAENAARLAARIAALLPPRP